MAGFTKLTKRQREQSVRERTNKLAEAQAKDHAILDYIGDGLVVVDKRGHIILVNLAAQEMLGWAMSRALGRPWTEVLRLTNDRSELLPARRRSLAIALATGAKVVDNDNYITRKDGRLFAAAITATPVLINNKIVGGVAIFRDITKQRELDRAKSEFISIASHQLRTPMTGIKWVVERLLKKEKISPTGREYLSDIHNSMVRLSSLVDQLLNVSRIESGGIGVTPEPLEVVEFIASYLAECRPLIDKKKLKLIFAVHPARLPAETDRHALRNIIQSLVSNAIEYTPDGGEVELTLGAKRQTFLLAVRDTGIGIPKDEQTSIFNKFYRGSNALKVKTDGTGLGLHIVKHAVSLLKGKITFESAENKGTTFFVELPLKSPAVSGQKTFA